jgi:hypothetical protein
MTSRPLAGGDKIAVLQLAGCAARCGASYGANGGFGGKAVEKPVRVHDIPATILRLIGAGHRKLTQRRRPFRQRRNPARFYRAGKRYPPANAP